MPHEADPFAVFLEESVKTEQGVNEHELWSYELVQALGNRSVQHIWHPDKIQRGERFRSAVSQAVQFGLTTDDAEHAVSERFIAEHSAATRTLMLKTVRYDASQPEAIRTIRRFQRELMVDVHETSELGERWYEAIRDVLPAESIDFVHGEHLSISVDLIERKLQDDSARTRVIEQVGTIMLQEKPHEVPDAHTILLTSLISSRLIRGRNSANTEEFLHDLHAKQSITAEQLHALKQLIQITHSTWMVL